MIKPGSPGEHNVVLDTTSNTRPEVGSQRTDVDECCSGSKYFVIQYSTVIDADVSFWNSNIHNPLLNGGLQFLWGGQIVHDIAFDTHDISRFDQFLPGLSRILFLSKM